MAVDFDFAAYESGNATRALDGFGIDLPADAEQWVNRLNDLRQNPPEQPAHSLVAELIADAADPAVIDAAVAAQVGVGHRIQAHTVAQNIVGQRVLDAILADRNRIHSQLRTTADETIARLHRAAAIDENIVDLTRQRRTEDAHLVATADADAETLRSLFYVRDEYLTPPSTPWSTGWWDCGKFENPWDIKHPNPKDDSLFGVWRAEVAAGGRLWYPTIDEARAASQIREPAEVLPPIDPYRTGTGMFVG